jgi:hypothetical protein
LSVGREANNLTVKTKLFRNHIISLRWREEWRQIVQEAKAHPAPRGRKEIMSHVTVPHGDRYTKREFLLILNRPFYVGFDVLTP